MDVQANQGGDSQRDMLSKWPGQKKGSNLIKMGRQE